MITEFGYMDEGFQPDIEGLLSSEHKIYFSRWKFSKLATPAPTPTRNERAAVWYGRGISQYNESPVLAVVQDRLKRVDSLDRIWYIGACVLKEEYEIGNFSTQIEISKTAIDSALHGPNSFYFAIELLKNFMPLESIKK